MTKEQLQERNKRFAIATIKFAQSLPSDRVYDALVRQIVRSSSSIGANYRSACRAKSKADFINKLKIVEEETDETIYFLDLINEIGTKYQEEVNKLMREGNELLSIYVASIKTVKNN